jgi:hypothetical protein
VSRRSLAILVLALCCFGSAGAALAQVSPAHVVLVFIDGPRYSESFAQPQRIPRIWNDLRPTGCILTGFRNDGYTLTVSGHSTTLTGRRQFLANDGSERPHDLTLFERYRMGSGQPSSSVWVVAGKSKLNVLAYSDDPAGGIAYAAEDSVGMGADIPTMETVLGILALDQPRFVAVNLPEVDLIAHSGDWEGYLAAITRADSLVGVLWDYLQSDAEYAGKSALIVTADHGRHNDRPGEPHDGFQSHGDTCDGCQHIILAAAGVGIRSGVQISTTSDQSDLGATLAKLMNIDAGGMEGFPIYAMLETPTAAPASRKYGARILGVVPQPFQAGGSILLAPRQGAAFALSIFDQRGRRVRSFHNPGVLQSEYFLHWDGRDYAGRPVASGVYYLRLRDARSTDRFSLTLLR